jgi:hypothetical protein
MSNPNVSMVCEPNPGVNCCPDDLWRKQAVKSLPHQQQAGSRRLFKLESVGEVEIGVQQHQFSARIAQQQRIGDFAPTWMAASKSAQITVPSEEIRLTIAQVVLGVNLPLMDLYIKGRHRVGQLPLVLLGIGDEMDIENFKRVAKQAF